MAEKLLHSDRKTTTFLSERLKTRACAQSHFHVRVYKCKHVSQKMYYLQKEKIALELIKIIFLLIISLISFILILGCVNV